MSGAAVFPEVLLRMFAFIDWQPAGCSSAIAQAEAAMLAGVESPSLYILAGLVPDLTDRDEIHIHLARMCQELGLPKPSMRASLHSYARYLAERYLSGSLTPRDFCDRLLLLANEDEEGLERHTWLILHADLEGALEGRGHEGVAEVEPRIRQAAERLAATRERLE